MGILVNHHITGMVRDICIFSGHFSWPTEKFFDQNLSRLGFSTDLIDDLRRITPWEGQDGP